MPTSSPEYKALERFVTADKRYRKFVYALTIVGFFTLIGVGYLLANNAIKESKRTVAKAADGQNTFVRTVIKESIRYNTCIYIVPIEKRTPDVQQRCFELADLKGGLSRADFSTIALPDDAILALPSVVPGQTSSGVSSPSSSPNNTPSQQKQGTNNSQSTTPAGTPPPSPTLGERAHAILKALNPFN
jgi:hypothetical protein